MAKAIAKHGRFRDKRIIGNSLHNVIIENGKIVEDLGPVKKEQPYIEEQPIEDEKPTGGLQLVTEDEVKKIHRNSTTLDIPEEQEKPTSGLQLSTDDDTTIKEQKPISGIKLIPISVLTTGNKPTWENILNNIPEPDPERHIETTVTEAPIQVEPQKVLEQTPIPEPPKPPQIPEIKIPKIQINIPKEKKDVNMPIPGVPTRTITTPVTTDTYRDETQVVGTNLQKADEGVITQQPKTNINKPKPKERRYMEDGLEAELLNERKFEEWIKKQKFRENLEKAARFAEETKEQFEQKIPELSEKIVGITDEVKGVENRLGNVDKSVVDLCTGVDCIKEDVKKYQDNVTKYQDNVSKYQDSQVALEKMVQQRFEELGEKVQGLEHPTLTCENCGEQVISPLSSYCPNCGSPVYSWADEDGQPVRGWTPYWKRVGREIP